jgi:hypothetical protein
MAFGAPAMTLHGKVFNGVVVFDDPANLPEGTPVTVLVEPTNTTAAPAPSDRLSEAEYQRRRAILDEIVALPNENPGDTFSGRDHDKVLYGEP